MVTKTVTSEPEHDRSQKGGTYPLSDIAIVRMRGGDIPDPGSEAEELVLAAWEAYRYIRALAQRTGKEAARDGRSGLDVNLNIQDVFRAVWPAGQSPLPKAGTEHDEARRMLTAWLQLHKNLQLVERGSPGIHAKQATLPSKPSRWWVAEEFAGAPEGMRLPETSAVTGEVLREPAVAASGPVLRDWWCPYFNQCGLGAPMTELEMGQHFIDWHKARRGSFLFTNFMDDARKLHEQTHPEPQQEPEPAPEPGVLTSLVPPAPEPEPAAPPVQTAPGMSATARTRTRTLAAPVPGGHIVSAQARVFAGHVAELEDEVTRLRRENADLRRRLADKHDQPLNVTVSAASLDLLARRIVRLMKSEDEHS